MNPKTPSTSSEDPVKEKILVRNITPIVLPKPRVSHDLTVFEALKKRKTTRSIQGKDLSLQQLSNLLWAAFGVNRMNGPFGLHGRTAASASNSQEIDIYVAKSEGVYRYDEDSHILIPEFEGDLRMLALGAGQMSAKGPAPVHFIYIVDIEKFNKAGYPEPGLYDPEIQKAYYYVDTGLIAQNVYLFAASQGLAAWFHNCNRHALTERLNLRPGQRVLFGQTVGYPKD